MKWIPAYSGKIPVPYLSLIDRIRCVSDKLKIKIKLPLCQAPHNESLYADWSQV
jgi:hypothetical protein